MGLVRFFARVLINFNGDRTIRVGRSRVKSHSESIQECVVTSNNLIYAPSVGSCLVAQPRAMVEEDDRVRAQLRYGISNFGGIPSMRLVLLRFFRVTRTRPLMVTVNEGAIQRILPCRSTHGQALIRDGVLYCVSVFLHLYLFARAIPVLRHYVYIFVDEPVLLFVGFLCALDLFLYRSSANWLYDGLALIFSLLRTHLRVFRRLLIARELLYGREAQRNGGWSRCKW